MKKCNFIRNQLVSVYFWTSISQESLIQASSFFGLWTIERKCLVKIFPFFSLFNDKKCNDRQNLDKHLKNVFTVKQFTIEKYIFPETGARRCSVKKMFLKIVQNSQENTCARASFLIILQAWGLWLYQKIHFVWNRCFKWIFAKFLRAPFW